MYGTLLRLSKHEFKLASQRLKEAFKLRVDIKN